MGKSGWFPVKIFPSTNPLKYWNELQHKDKNQRTDFLLISAKVRNIGNGVSPVYVE